MPLVLQGTDHLADDVEASFQCLAVAMTVTASECASHSILEIGGFEGDEVLQAAAVYLVGSIAQCIHADLKIREALFDERTMQRDLTRDVIDVIGAQDADEQFKSMVRDPWLWEGICHLFVHLAQPNTHFHPSGAVLAKTLLKFDVHDHGLDVIGIYAADRLGISAGECKAYLSDPSRGITDASNKLGEIDSSLRDIEVRAAVNQLQSALTAERRAEIAGAFWRTERSYFPFVCCDQEHAAEWNRRRPILESLAAPVSKKILVPLSMTGARAQLDRLCDFMRNYVSPAGDPEDV